MSWMAFQKERVERRETDVPWFVGDKTAAYDFAKLHGVDVPRLYRLFDAPEEFRDEGFPDRFVVKPKGLHSNKGVMVLKRLEPGVYFDAMKRRRITEEGIRAEQVGWFGQTPFRNSYKLIVEEKLIGENGEDEIPYDYKFFMFHGENGMIVQMNRNTVPPTAAWFGADWAGLDIDRNFESEWKLLQRGPAVRPACADGLLRAARTLSLALPTPFVSVDMYATTRGAVLGELTLAPGGPYYGRQYRFRDHFDQQLGATWRAALARLGRS